MSFDPRAAEKTPAANGYQLPAAVDAKTRERFAEFQGREPHPSAAGQMCFHIKQPNFPQYRFEWHPGTRKVYLIRMGAFDADGVFRPAKGTLMGEILAEHAETHGDAFNYVQTFLRGFREGQTPTIAKTHLEG